ncbi:class III signal peptide-containing protein [Thermococcus kodakarensis]|nr:class III signal peptide-containing protein [Thermococcus kodakarensis]WCN27396.1 class III signal peptide-containing protein [Thermococcus kodakarensis]WCN29686.1 class III signal peptide-containing protein [Thermococcus kodakarensis]
MMRRAQGALEYLFMVALALIMVTITIRYVHEVAQNVAVQINQTTKEISEILKNMTSSGR